MGCFHDAAGHPAPDARLAAALDVPRDQLRPPEHGAEQRPLLGQQRQPEGQQRGQQRQRRDQGDADGDGERAAEVGVEGEGCEQQRQHRRDHRGRGECDGLTDLGHRADDRVPGRGPGVEEVAEQAAAQAASAGVVLARGGVRPGSQRLADPEDQEQPVVGARAQHQHDHQELGDGGDLEPVLGGLRDQWPGDGEREQRRYDRHQGEGERPEDQDQQHEDEQQRQELDLGAGVTRSLLLVHLRGDVTRHVRLHPGGQVRLDDLGAQAVDQIGGVVLVAAALLCEHDQLDRVPVGGYAGVLHLGHPADRLQPGGQRGDRAEVGLGQRRA